MQFLKFLVNFRNTKQCEKYTCPQIVTVWFMQLGLFCKVHFLFSNTRKEAAYFFVASMAPMVEYCFMTYPMELLPHQR